MRIVLASKSPRRRELLQEVISNFEIITHEVDETLPEGIHPRKGVEILAIRKGEVVAKDATEAIVISSDTLVELDGVALGKPPTKKMHTECFAVCRVRRTMCIPALPFM